jgi:hypothetical protein
MSSSGITMPLIDFNDPATWDGGPTSLYRDGEGRGFVRETRGSYYGDEGQDAVKLGEALDVQPGDSVIIIGGAFGWIAELWEAQGLDPMIVTDSSRWIHANKGEHATHAILDEDSLSEESRMAILAAAGLYGEERATWCISEDVMPALADAEALALSTAMRAMGVNVAHWVSCKMVDQDPRLNWKTLEEWKELLAPDLVVARNENGRVL